MSFEVFFCRRVRTSVCKEYEFDINVRGWTVVYIWLEVYNTFVGDSDQLLRSENIHLEDYK